MKTCVRLLILGAGLSVHIVCTAGQLFSQDGIVVRSNEECGETVTISLTAPSESELLASRNKLQDATKAARTYLSFDCKQIETLRVEGFVAGQPEPVYQGTAKKTDRWTLIEGPAPVSEEPEQAVVEDSTEPEKVFDDIAELEQAATEGNEEAQLELAAGLTGDPESLKNIDFPQDPERGVELLEDLADRDVVDSGHLLGRAYVRHPQIKRNTRIVQRSLRGTRRATNQRVSSRRMHTNRRVTSRRMTMRSARRGGMRAMGSMMSLGFGGFPMGFYSLGMMFMMDSGSMMSNASAVSSMTGLDSNGSDGSPSNVDVGMHLMKMAADAGHQQAQNFLKDLEVEYKNYNEAFKEQFEEAGGNPELQTQGPYWASGDLEVQQDLTEVLEVQTSEMASAGGSGGGSQSAAAQRKTGASEAPASEKGESEKGKPILID